MVRISLVDLGHLLSTRARLGRSVSLYSEEYGDPHARPELDSQSVSSLLFGNRSVDRLGVLTRLVGETWSLYRVEQTLRRCGAADPWQPNAIVRAVPLERLLTQNRTATGDVGALKGHPRRFNYVTVTDTSFWMA